MSNEMILPVHGPPPQQSQRKQSSDKVVVDCSLNHLYVLFMLNVTLNDFNSR